MFDSFLNESLNNKQTIKEGERINLLHEMSESTADSTNSSLIDQICSNHKIVTMILRTTPLSVANQTIQQLKAFIVQNRSHKLSSFQKEETSSSHQNSKLIKQQRKVSVTGKMSTTFTRQKPKLGGAIMGAFFVASLVLCLLRQISPVQSESAAPSSTNLPELVDENFSLPSTIASNLTGATSDSTTSIADSELNSSTNQPPSAASNKLKPVNFTLVDEVFDAVLSEEEIVKKWKHMDLQLQDGMRSILKMVFPQIVSISQDAKVSGDCSGGILKWILSLRNLRSWAIKMLDATGKPSAGIFQGALTMFGNYRQCLNIRAPDEDEIELTDQFEEYFRGQFCVLHLKPWMPTKQPFYHLNSTIDFLLRKNYKYYDKTLYDELAEIAIAFNFVDIRMDLCVPSTCTVADIQRVAELLSKKLDMRAKVMRCDIAPREAGLFNQIDRITFIWSSIPSLLILVSILSTILLILVRKQKESRSSQEVEHNNQITIFEALKCLSIGDNCRDRLTQEPNLTTKFRDTQRSTVSLDLNFELKKETDEENSKTEQPINMKPMPLYGLRNIFIIWFIIVQMTVELKYQYLRESLPLRDMIIAYWPFQIIINSTLLFESLIVITAFTYSYVNIESSLKGLMIYIADKYIRLILSIVTIVALTIITPILALESPVWKNFVEQQSNVCKSTGYLNLFFLQNFISYDKICLPHTWLLCVELQLIILTVPVMLLLKSTFLTIENSVIIKRGSDIEEENRGNFKERLFCTTISSLLKSKAGILNLAFIIIGVVVNFTIVYTNQLPPSWFYTFPDIAQKNYYFSQYLTKTWTHLSAFIIGLLGGHVCKTMIQLRKNGPQPSTQHPSPFMSTHLTSHQSQSGSTSTMMPIDQANGYKTRSAANCRKTTLRNLYQVAALISMFALIFSTFYWSTNQAPTALVAALYDASSRLIWSLALVSLMIQLCMDSGSSSRAVQIFSHPICTVFGRLSFLAYLISPYINTFILAVAEQALFPSLFIMFHVIVGNIVIIYTIALILAIMIENPLRRLIRRTIFRC